MVPAWRSKLSEGFVDLLGNASELDGYAVWKFKLVHFSLQVGGGRPNIAGQDIGCDGYNHFPSMRIMESGVVPFSTLAHILDRHFDTEWRGDGFVLDFFDALIGFAVRLNVNTL